MGKTIKFKDTYPSATNFFSEWAETGKDEGMEKGHADSVDFILWPELVTVWSSQAEARLL